MKENLDVLTEMKKTSQVLDHQALQSFPMEDQKGKDEELDDCIGPSSEVKDYVDPMRDLCIPAQEQLKCANATPQFNKI